MMPAKDRRRLDEEAHRSPRRCEPGSDDDRESLPRPPSDAPYDFPLGHDQLLPEHRVLPEKRGMRPEEVSEESANEAEEIEHGLGVLRFRVRM
jgi:hypothetical protein